MAAATSSSPPEAGRAAAGGAGGQRPTGGGATAAAAVGAAGRPGPGRRLRHQPGCLGISVTLQQAHHQRASGVHQEHAAEVVAAGSPAATAQGQQQRACTSRQGWGVGGCWWVVWVGGAQRQQATPSQTQGRLEGRRLPACKCAGMQCSGRRPKQCQEAQAVGWATAYSRGAPDRPQSGPRPPHTQQQQHQPTRARPRCCPSHPRAPAPPPHHTQQPE